MCLTCCSATLGSIPIRIFCSRRPVRPKADNTCRRPFLSSFGTRRRTTTVPQLVAEGIKHQEEESPLVRVRNRLHNAGLYARRPVACVPIQRTTAKGVLMLGKRTCFLDAATIASVLFKRVRFTMGDFTDLENSALETTTENVFEHGGTVTGLRCRDETLDPYVAHMLLRNDFILMDDNADLNMSRIVRSIGGSRFGTNGMASSISRLER
ncbi:HTH_Tnp_Tc3_2 domain-containing protein [Trichonephila clavipes]|nr:HTH_Tnp_Tc3_2 domain-containing protein [Trichonephila clavipes]